jgi:hypothetical protein
MKYIERMLSIFWLRLIVSCPACFDWLNLSMEFTPIFLAYTRKTVITL